MATASGFRAIAIETVISEWDHTMRHPQSEILRWAKRLRPDFAIERLDIRRLHELQHGYKIFGIFIAE